MSNKPIPPGEFIAICDRLRPGIPMVDIDAAYRMLGEYQPPPETPWMATSMVILALQQVGFTGLMIQ